MTTERLNELKDFVELVALREDRRDLLALIDTSTPAPVVREPYFYGTIMICPCCAERKINSDDKYCRKCGKRLET